MAKNPPTVRMRRLGAQLRNIRRDRGLTLDEAADLLNLSKSALNRMENAQVITRRHEVEYLLIKYEVTDRDLHDSLLGLAAAGHSRDWVKRYGPLAPEPNVGDFIRLEQDSTAVRTFQPIVIPGLLQTPDYARAVMQSVVHDPARDLDSSVAYRMARQEVLTRPRPARLEAVIGEAALRQRQGTSQVMADQLRHLVEVSQRDNIAVSVLPFDAPRNPGTDGPFTMLDVETGGFTAAIVESLARTVCVEDETAVERYNVVFAELCALALPGAETRALIERMARELETSAGEGAA